MRTLRLEASPEPKPLEYQPSRMLIRPQEAPNIRPNLIQSTAPPITTQVTNPDRSCRPKETPRIPNPFVKVPRPERKPIVLRSDPPVNPFLHVMNRRIQRQRLRGPIDWNQIQAQLDAARTPSWTLEEELYKYQERHPEESDRTEDLDLEFDPRIYSTTLGRSHLLDQGDLSQNSYLDVDDHFTTIIGEPTGNASPPLPDRTTSHKQRDPNKPSYAPLLVHQGRQIKWPAKIDELSPEELAIVLDRVQYLDTLPRPKSPDKPWDTSFSFQREDKRDRPSDSAS